LLVRELDLKLPSAIELNHDPQAIAEKDAISEPAAPSDARSWGYRAQTKPLRANHPFRAAAGQRTTWKLDRFSWCV